MKSNIKQSNINWSSIGNIGTLKKELDKISYMKESIDNLNIILLEFNILNDNFLHSNYLKILEKIIHTINKNLLKKGKFFYVEKNQLIILSFSDKKSLYNNMKKIKEIMDNKAFKIKDKDIKIILSYSISNINTKKICFEYIINSLHEKLEKRTTNDINVNLPSFPNSITINNKENYLDKVLKKSTQLYLIAKNDDIEIIRQHIASDKTIQIRAGDKGNFELFYILNGEIYCEEEDIILTPGDSITSKSGDGEKYFKTLTEVELLYITSIPIFASEQKRINDLLSLNKKMAEKDIETNEHCNRLQTLSRLTALEMGLKGEKLFHLGYASFLHDIGKAKVPAKLLKKPAKLTEKEWDIMKKHTNWGKEIILKNFTSKDFKKIAEIINQHHERWNGKGYPQGLKGDEILIEAQILSVVDAYDAMTFERPYQKALSREEALKEIKSEKGKQFSPKAVEAFLKAEIKFQK